MQFRRSGQRDERRRRVLLDETLQPKQPEETPTTTVKTEVTVKPRRYSEAAKADRQPPITCLIPQRPWTVGLLVLLGLVGIAAVENLYTQVYLAAPPGLQPALTGLDVASRGSIASWYAALLLTTAALSSVQTFALRRHRLDDYRGRYRVWLWIPAVLLLAGLNAATGLHIGVAALLQNRFGTAISAAPVVWQLGLLWATCGLVGLRICGEISRSRLAMVSALTAVALYGMASLIELQLWLGQDELLSATVGAACLLGGHLAIAMSAIAYCRFVYLEAQLAAPPAQPVRRARKRRTDQSRKRTTKTTAPAAAATPPAGEQDAKPPRSKQRKVRVDEAHEDAASRSRQQSEHSAAEVEEEAGHQRLNKAERRRLRKQSRKQARAEQD